MKKLFVLFLAVLPLLSFNSYQDGFDIKGKWVGEDKGDIGYFIFDDEGYAVLEAQGQVLGGKSFNMQGQECSMTYTINYDATPIEIDFTVTVLKTKNQRKMLFIAEFESKKALKLASSFNDTRPTEFTDINSIQLIKLDD